MVLSREQFQALRSKGLSTEQIAKFESKPVNPVQSSLNKMAGEATNVIGKGMMPGRMISDVVKGQLGDISPTAQSLGEGALGAVNTAGFGIPKLLAKKGLESVGLNLPQPKSKTAEQVGGAVGMIGSGGLVRAGLKRATPALFGGGITRSIGRGATEGALTGALQTPESGLLDGQERLKQAKLGAAVGAVAEPIAMGIGNVARATSGKTKFARQLRGEVYGSKKAAGNAFDQALEQSTLNNPNASADLSDAANRLRMLRTYDPRIDSFIKSHPDLLSMVDNPDVAKQLNARQAQDMINTMKQSLGNSKFGSGNFRPEDMPLLEVIDDMKMAQASAYPEMKGARAAYGKNREAFKTVRPDLSKRSLEKRITQGFTTGEVGDEFKNLLGPDTMRKLKGAQFAGRALKTASGPLGMAGGGLALGGLAIHQILKQMRGGE